MAGRRALSEAERVDWLRLARSEGVGPVTFFGLLARFGTAGAAVEALPGLIAATGRKAMRVATRASVEAEIAATAAIGGRLLAACEPDYPLALAALTPPPPVIAVRGDVSLFRRPCVGIVGARNASAAGLRIARDMASGLGRAGHVVVSGLARGIDGAAHAASLQTGTIAVLAGGLDHVYPPEHADLHARVAELGALVSESPLAAAVHARDFPRRNRIISGLSLGVVVVEAEARSGSLITARFAAEQGREVLAVPGSPLDPRAAGPNNLIRDGARLTTGAEDVIEALRGGAGLAEREGEAFSRDPVPLTPDADLVARVATLLSPTPASLEDLVRDTGLPWRTLAAIIVELELDGRAVTQPGGRVSAPV
jgi:DNA processing protein